MRVCMCMCVGMRVHACVCVHVSVHACGYVHVDVCMSVCVYCVPVEAERRGWIS